MKWQEGCQLSQFLPSDMNSSSALVKCWLLSVSTFSCSDLQHMSLEVFCWSFSITFGFMSSGMDSSRVWISYYKRYCASYFILFRCSFSRLSSSLALWVFILFWILRLSTTVSFLPFSSTPSLINFVHWLNFSLLSASYMSTSLPFLPRASFTFLL